MGEGGLSFGSGEAVASDELAVRIVAAYVRAHNVPKAQLPSLIITVRCALRAIGLSEVTGASDARISAVPVENSLTPEHLVCLEDGLPFKSLKRHLREQHQMSPNDYRAKWNLVPDYPMVAPLYSEKRSQLAKKMGLGGTPKSGERRR